MIRFEEIEVGDQVALLDEHKNVARGLVGHDHDQRLAIVAFGVSIAFARTNMNGRLVPVGHVKVVEHTPALVSAAEGGVWR